ncbi:MAG: hypothetical protein HSCHL_0323 [Hydrogenibacillus schlegelii]|uniref:Uncharacterized protein n=1 Tax=Hydrogenibacillus schlegelii TaxID=1484 RepID=A0A2T5GDZ1_HYDSH|nr:MAG: hypothetical protein HSCHL_0323 [Hydrogenibacillus schlegelii]
MPHPARPFPSLEGSAEGPFWLRQALVCRADDVSCPFRSVAEKPIS